MYFAPKSSQDVAFSEPTDIMHEIWKTNDPSSHRVQRLAHIGAHELADGGGVDKNGIATAVASKPEANVVFVVDVVYDEFSTWKKHFEGFKDETGFPDPSEKVSTGGNHVRVSSNHNTFY